ncbi:MAG: hypothetical protein ACPLKP_01830 [Microgenomates group bacterium]
MAIIISKSGQNAIKIEKSDLENEKHLQQYIYNNPESIPLYNIKEDIRLLILAREFSTKSGPIDALGIDKDGEIYLIETKLYKNSDKRMVVAQVLDYGASLWSNYRDFNNFINQIETHTFKDFNQNLSQRLNDFFGISKEEEKTLLENVRRNLNEGNFKFVVLMDHLHDQLKDLIIFLNNNSEFTIYAVELEYYKHQDFEILIPKLYGAEIKKDIGKNTPVIPTDDDFIKAFQGQPEENKVKELIDFFNDLREGRKKIKNVTVAKTFKNLNFYVTTSYQDKISISLYIQRREGSLDFWGTKKIDQIVREKIKKLLPRAEIQKEMTTSFGIIAKWPMKDYSTEKFEQLLRKLSQI